MLTCVHQDIQIQLFWSQGCIIRLLRFSLDALQCTENVVSELFAFIQSVLNHNRLSPILQALTKYVSNTRKKVFSAAIFFISPQIIK